MSTHYLQAKYLTPEQFAARGMYESVVTTCGTYLNAYKAQHGQATYDEALVTCKRCLKCMAPGMSVELGHLVSPSSGLR